MVHQHPLLLRVKRFRWAGLQAYPNRAKSFQLHLGHCAPTNPFRRFPFHTWIVLNCNQLGHTFQTAALHIVWLTCFIIYSFRIPTEECPVEKCRASKYAKGRMFWLWLKKGAILYTGAFTHRSFYAQNNLIRTRSSYSPGAFTLRL